MMCDFLNVDIVELLCKLVEIDTTSKDRRNYDLMVNTLSGIAVDFGLKAKTVRDGRGIPHLIVTFPNSPSNGKKIVFLTHYDVVSPGEGWTVDPFKPVVENGRVYGRGSSDDKSSIAAALIAFREALEEGLTPNFKPELIIVGGEETGESEEFFRSITADIAVVLDVGPEGLSIGASGAARVEVQIQGAGCHSAYPYKCENPIYFAADLIKMLEKHGRWLVENVKSRYDAPCHYGKLPARLSVTVVQAGYEFNKIPSKATLIIDRRTIPEEDAFKAGRDVVGLVQRYAAENLSGRGLKIEAKIRGFVNGWATTDQEVIKKFSDILARVKGEKPKVTVELGGTDGAHLIDRMPVVQYGALREENNIHGVDEFVYIEDLCEVKEFVKSVLMEKF